MIITFPMLSPFCCSCPGLSLLPPVILPDEKMITPPQSKQSVTFSTNHSAVKILGYEGSYHLNISLELRTFEPSGVLLFHQFISGGSLCLSVRNGLVTASMVGRSHSQHSQHIMTMDSYTHVSDGDWHRVVFGVERGGGGARLGVDREVMTQMFGTQIRTGMRMNI